MMIKYLSDIPYKDSKTHSQNECLYRIMPLSQFMAMLIYGKNILLHPSSWEDPFEKLIEKFTVNLVDEPEIEPFHLDWDHWYGQCWTLQAVSDGLWRSFTHNKEVRSVKIKTTIGKLMNSYKPSASNKTILYVGKVNYSSEQNFLNESISLSKHYVKCLGIIDPSPKEIQHLCELSLLTLKRDAFEYENEFRLLAYRSKGYKKQSWGYNINVNELINEVEFDPWTPEYEQQLYKDLLSKKLGFEGDVNFSPLYKELGESKKQVLKIIKNN